MVADSSSFILTQGPVFVMLFVGIVDTASKAMTSGCLEWAFLGSFLLCFPVVIVGYGFYRIRTLQKQGALAFTKNTKRTFKEFWSDLQSHKGLRHKLSFLFVAIHDLRFAGEWAKKTKSAKFWGFFVANTGPYWFCFTFVLVKKICTPLLLNWTDGAFNAVAVAAIFWIDGFIFFCLSGHRDHAVNWSCALTAIGNGLAATMTAIQVILPSDLVPSWVTSPLVMFCMLGSTAVSGLQAMMDPVMQAFAFFKAVDIWTCLPALIAPIYPALKAAIPFLKARIERIFQMRVKNRAKADLHHEAMKDQGLEENAFVFRNCAVCDLQVQEDEGLFCCGKAPISQDHHHGNHDDGIMPGDDANTQPPHFTCASCLAGHVMLMIEEGGFWHKHLAIPCSLFPEACNDNRIQHKAIKNCLRNADELDALEDYLAVWYPIYGAEEQHRRERNLEEGRTSPVLVEIDELVNEIQDQLDIDQPTFEKTYPDWMNDVKKVEQYYLQDDVKEGHVCLKEMHMKYEKAKVPTAKAAGVSWSLGRKTSVAQTVAIKKRRGLRALRPSSKVMDDNSERETGSEILHFSEEVKIQFLELPAQATMEADAPPSLNSSPEPNSGPPTVPSTPDPVSTMSGKIIRAPGRHPLVEEADELIVSMRKALGRPTSKARKPPTLVFGDAWRSNVRSLQVDGLVACGPFQATTRDSEVDEHKGKGKEPVKPSPNSLPPSLPNSP